MLGKVHRGHTVGSCRIERCRDAACEAYLGFMLEPASGGVRVLASAPGYVWDGDRSVTWHLVERGSMLTSMDGSYELEPVGDDSTRVTYQLSVDVSIPMLGMLKRKAEKVIIDTALKGLKRHVEGTRG